MQAMRSTPMRILAGLLLAGAGVLAGQTSGPATSLLHKPAPQFIRTDLDHQRVNIASYRGKVVLLTFWATWCAPCQIEMPRFIEWQSRYGPAGLQIIGVSMDDEAAPVIALTRKRHVNYPIVMGDEQLGREYGGILGLPVTFLIDRDGKIAARFKGETKLTVLEAAVKRQLNPSGNR